MARHILRRAGIAPLIPAIAVLLVAAPAPVHPQSQLDARGTGTARVIVLPSSARIEGGRLLLREGGQTGAPPLAPRPQERACEPAPGTPAPPCRLLVYDLP